MRRLLAFLLFFVLFPVQIFAETTGKDFADADSNLVFNKFSSSNKNILNGSFNSDDAAVVAEIEQVLKEKSPETVSKMQGESDSAKLVVYRSKLAELAFDEYERAFKEMLKYKSKETGREVKQKSSTSGCKKMTKYWLDEGDLDTSKCTPPDYVYDSSKEYVDWMTKNACFYPDGFEEHAVSITKITCDNWTDGEDRSLGELFVVDDYKDKNVRIVYSIGTSTHGIIHKSDNVSENFVDVFLDLVNTSESYDEYYQSKNQEVKDIRAGMYESCERDSSDSTEEKCLYNIDYSKDWKSAKGNMTRVKSQTINYSSSHTSKRLND